MKRRTFIAGLGCAAGWPLVARGQQPERMRLIGALTGAADEPNIQARYAVFRQELQKLGWTDGRNIRFDYRWGGGDIKKTRREAEQLVALAPDVILAIGGPAMERLHQVARTVPIVFVIVPDPVGSGLVARLSKPGGNATGFMQFEYSLAGKWPELLKQIAPGVTRVAAIRHPSLSAGIGQFGAIQAVARSLRIEVSAVTVRDASEVERALTAFARGSNGGLIV